MTLTDKLERGEITIGFEHKRLERLILSLEGASNRLSLGIIIASMLIASSMIMTTGFEPRLFGFPALGVIGYMISGRARHLAHRGHYPLQKILSFRRL